MEAKSETAEAPIYAQPSSKGSTMGTVGEPPGHSGGGEQETGVRLAWRRQHGRKNTAT